MGDTESKPTHQHDYDDDQQQKTETTTTTTKSTEKINRSLEEFDKRVMRLHKEMQRHKKAQHDLVREMDENLTL